MRTSLDQRCDYVTNLKINLALAAVASVCLLAACAAALSVCRELIDDRVFVLFFAAGVSFFGLFAAEYLELCWRKFFDWFVLKRLR